MSQITINEKGKTERFYGQYVVTISKREQMIHISKYISLHGESSSSIPHIIALSFPSAMLSEVIEALQTVNK